MPVTAAGCRQRQQQHKNSHSLRHLTRVFATADTLLLGFISSISCDTRELQQGQRVFLWPAAPAYCIVAW